MWLSTASSMIIIVLFIYITSVNSDGVNSTCDSCTKVNRTCYNVSYLFDIEAPFRNRIVITKLGILRSMNTLFYSFEPKIEDKEYFKTGFINLSNHTVNGVISGDKQIMNFGTFDIDQDNGLVYLGGCDGIYALDTKLNRVAPYSSRGDLITNIFYKGFIYFVRYGECKIIKKKGDNFETLLENTKVKNFVVSKYNVIVFLSIYGLFASRRDEVVRLSTNPFFRGLVVDLEDNIYAWWIDGIYKVMLEPRFADSRIEKVAGIPNIGAMTFDRENKFVFTVGKSLFTLVQTSNTTVC